MHVGNQIGARRPRGPERRFHGRGQDLVQQSSVGSTPGLRLWSRKCRPRHGGLAGGSPRRTALTPGSQTGSKPPGSRESNRKNRRSQLAPAIRRVWIHHGSSGSLPMPYFRCLALCLALHPVAILAGDGGRAIVHLEIKRGVEAWSGQMVDFGLGARTSSLRRVRSGPAKLPAPPFWPGRLRASPALIVW
jgi:hypothetical protein